MTRLSSVLVNVALLGFAAAQNCKVLNNLHYCDEVEAITYANIGAAGTYQDVIGYDGDSCSCPRAPKNFSGPLAPLDEQVRNFYISALVYANEPSDSHDLSSSPFISVVL